MKPSTEESTREAPPRRGRSIPRLGERQLKRLAPIRRFFYYYRTLEVNVYAAYASYFILLSVFPALMLLISILQLTSLSSVELEILLKGLVPESLSGMVEYLVKELFASNSMAVLSVSAAAALWMSSKGVYSLHRGLNKVYNQGITRNSLVVRLECALFTLLLFAGLLVTVVLQVLRKRSVSPVRSLLSPVNTLACLCL